MIGPRPCADTCAYLDPVFTSQSYDINMSISISTRTSLSVFLVFMPMSAQFSLAYTCACAYDYALVKTRLSPARPEHENQEALGDTGFEVLDFRTSGHF